MDFSLLNTNSLIWGHCHCIQSSSTSLHFQLQLRSSTDPERVSFWHFQWDFTFNCTYLGPREAVLGPPKGMTILAQQSVLLFNTWCVTYEVCFLQFCWVAWFYFLFTYRTKDVGLLPSSWPKEKYGAIVLSCTRLSKEYIILISYNCVKCQRHL